jgi:uncharacterized alkaline shock family protein YloU
MKKQEEKNTIGNNVSISNNVIARCAGSATNSTSGVVGMASVDPVDGIAKLLSNDKLGKGVKVSTDKDGIKIDLHIIVAYGVNIQSVADNVIENVKYKVEEFTSMTVKQINVFVESVKIIN